MEEVLDEYIKRCCDKIKRKDWVSCSGHGTHVKRIHNLRAFNFHLDSRGMRVDNE